MSALRRFGRRRYTFPRVSQIRWSPAQPPPLRIVFCGSDEFSAVTLAKLNEERQSNPSLIKSLDVVIKQGKKSGRGMKSVKEVPIKSLAEQLGLPLHEIPTFTGWRAPSPFDLIIAVSFGLKVPPRLIRAARYGGLNVHPSLLPDLRGPAPLHYALLEGRTSSGVTLQTLHPTEMDRGRIVAQRSFDLPHGGHCSIEELRQYVAPIAADLLVDELKSGSFARQGLALLQTPDDEEQEQTLTYARKIRPEDAHIDWQTWPAERILRTERVVSDTYSFHVSTRDGQERRVRWHKWSLVQGMRAADISSAQDAGLVPGVPRIISSTQIPGSRHEKHKATMVVPSSDGQLLQPESVTIEGRKRHQDPVSEVRFLSKPPNRWR